MADETANGREAQEEGDESVEENETEPGQQPVGLKKSSKFTKAELQNPGKVVSYMGQSIISPKSSTPLLNFAEYTSQFAAHRESANRSSVINQTNVHTATQSEPQSGFGGAALFERRSPYIHDPPVLEERIPRIESPSGFRDYLINLREDLADFQESHGLPRTRDYSFMSLGLALLQETGRAIYAVLVMFTELFPVLQILSLIFRFVLDKLIDIVETPEPGIRIKKSAIFVVQLVLIVVPVYILIGTILVPLVYLLFSIIGRLFRITTKKKKKSLTVSKIPCACVRF